MQVNGRFRGGENDYPSPEYKNNLIGIQVFSEWWTRPDPPQRIVKAILTDLGSGFLQKGYICLDWLLLGKISIHFPDFATIEPLPRHGVSLV